MKRTLRIAAIALLAIGVTFVSALAEQYPSRPIRLIVPFPPGGGSDILARAIAPKLTDGLGQSVFVFNQPGAAGNIAARALLADLPDGYNVLLAANTLAINYALDPKQSVNPIKDLSPVALLASATMVLVVNPSLPVTNLKELIELAKKRPGEINFANGGTGTPHYFATALLAKMADIEVTHIPYKGNGEVLPDLLAGVVQASIITLGTVKPFIASGGLRALAVTSASRAEIMPELPTVAEAGVPGFSADAWYGAFLPAGAPADVVNRLNEQFGKALSSPEVRKQLTALGFESEFGSPEKLHETLKEDLGKYVKVVDKGTFQAQ